MFLRALMRKLRRRLKRKSPRAPAGLSRPAEPSTPLLSAHETETETQATEELSSRRPAVMAEPEQTHAPPKDDQPRCHLLELPVELILIIGERLLGPLSRVFFRHTCRALYNILLHTARQDVYVLCRVKGQVRRTYFAITIRDSPRQWLCNICNVSHRVSPDDTPAAAPISAVYIPFSPTKPRFYRKRHHQHENNCLPTTLTRLRFQHIQMALKFTRLYAALTPAQRDNLEELMAPFTRSVYAFWQAALEKQHPAYARCCPRIVRPKGKKPRYIVQATIKLEKDFFQIYPGARTSLFNICCHQAVSNIPDAEPTSTIARPLPVNLVRAVHIDALILACLMEDENRAKKARFLHSIGRSMPDGSRGGGSGSCGHKSISSIEYGYGGDFGGSCSLCWTDYCVRANSSHVEIRVWQDFAEEHQPALFFDTEETEVTPIEEIMVSQYFYSHRPNCVRELYESGEVLMSSEEAES